MEFNNSSFTNRFQPSRVISMNSGIIAWKWSFIMFWSLILLYSDSSSSQLSPFAILKFVIDQLVLIGIDFFDLVLQFSFLTISSPHKHAFQKYRARASSKLESYLLFGPFFLSWVSFYLFICLGLKVWPKVLSNFDTNIDSFSSFFSYSR